MISALLLLLLVAGLIALLYYRKPHRPQARGRRLSRLLLLSALLCFLIVLLALGGYSLRGTYTPTVIGSLFILSSVGYLALAPLRRSRLILALMLLVFSGYYRLKESNRYQTQPGPGYTLRVKSGGLLACGNSLSLTKSSFLLFEREVWYENGLCLSGIYRVETVYFKPDSAEFLLYHDGLLDSENPYPYRLVSQ